ncbi:MAG: MIP/aquaporin family protein [Candidatus Nanopelagicales bacterium]
MAAVHATAGLSRRLVAEFTGTAVLVAAVIGSGIMAVALTPDGGLQLLINAVSTVTALGVLIMVLGPISGAHFNPAVTGVAVALREIPGGEALAYVLVQVAGAITGATVANVMFALPAWQSSGHERVGPGLWLGEVVATAGLILVIGALTRTGRGHLGPVAVPAWIAAAYFFTASTSFANPAVTIGRAFTDTFTGIAWASVAPFIVAQLLGAALGAGLTAGLYPRRHPEPLDLPDPVHPQGVS